MLHLLILLFEGYILQDDTYLRQALKIIPDPNILINVVSRRVREYKYGIKPLVESYESLEPEQIALLEVIKGAISYQLYEPLV